MDEESFAAPVSVIPAPEAHQAHDTSAHLGSVIRSYHAKGPAPSPWVHMEDESATESRKVHPANEPPSQADIDRLTDEILGAGHTPAAHATYEPQWQGRGHTFAMPAQSNGNRVNRLEGWDYAHTFEAHTDTTTTPTDTPSTISIHSPGEVAAHARVAAQDVRPVIADPHPMGMASGMMTELVDWSGASGELPRRDYGSHQGLVGDLGAHFLASMHMHTSGMRLETDGTGRNEALYDTFHIGGPGFGMFGLGYFEPERVDEALLPRVQAYLQGLSPAQREAMNPIIHRSTQDAFVRQVAMGLITQDGFLEAEAQAAFTEHATTFVKLDAVVEDRYRNFQSTMGRAFNDDARALGTTHLEGYSLQGGILVSRETNPGFPRHQEVQQTVTGAINRVNYCPDQVTGILGTQPLKNRYIAGVMQRAAAIGRQMTRAHLS